MRKARIVGLKLLPIGIAAIAIFGFVISALWNWLMPAIFGLREITFWQALGLLVLARILVGGFGGGGKRRPRIAHGWDSLTPEERERFRRAMEEGH